MAGKVFVGSLPLGTKPKELRHLFQNFGIVIECDIKNRCGFVHMETPAMAETAILALNGSEFKGQMINVEPGRTNNMGQEINDGGNPGGPNFGSENRRFRDGVGPPSNRGGMSSRGGMFNRGGMSNRGGMPNRGIGVGGPPNRGGGPAHRGVGMPGRGGMGGNPFNNNRGGLQNRGGEINVGRGRGGGMINRGGHNEGRGGFNNRNQNEGGPMRNAPAFKQRPSPYPPMNGATPIEAGGPAARGGHARGGFTSPPNRNPNAQQRNSHWGGEQNKFGGPSQQQHGGNFQNMNAMGGPFGGGSMRNPNMNANFGQDRRGFTLDNAQPPMPHQQRQQPFGGNRRPNDRSNFNAPDEEVAGFRKPHTSDGPPQRGRGGGRGNFAAARGGQTRGVGRGSFRGGPGGGFPNFGPPPENGNNYNQQFPALQPTRGRGGFGDGNRGGNRGGFNRNAPNMSNRRQNM